MRQAVLAVVVNVIGGVLSGLMLHWYSSPAEMTLQPPQAMYATISRWTEASWPSRDLSARPVWLHHPWAWASY